MENKDLLEKQNEQLQKDIDVKKEATPEQIEMLSRSDDPFYSKSNINYLTNIAQDISEGKAHFAEHDLFEIDVTQEATPEQIEMLSRAADLPLPNDCDCPELTEEELRKFKRVSNFRDVD